MSEFTRFMSVEDYASGCAVPFGFSSAVADWLYDNQPADEHTSFEELHEQVCGGNWAEECCNFLEKNGPYKFEATGPNESLKDEFQGPVLATAFRSLTIRDYFAGQALAGFLQHLLRLTPTDDQDREHFQIAAERAYAIADAMLAAKDVQP